MSNPYNCQASHMFLQKFLTLQLSHAFFSKALKTLLKPKSRDTTISIQEDNIKRLLATFHDIDLCVLKDFCICSANLFVENKLHLSSGLSLRQYSVAPLDIMQPNLNVVTPHLRNWQGVSKPCSSAREFIQCHKKSVDLFFSVPLASISGTKSWTSSTCLACSMNT